MRLFEMSFLPISAGSAELFFEDDVHTPTRENTCIRLPRHEGRAEYFQLKGGSQFLFSYRNSLRERQEVFFGGTDENPFLVQLEEQALDAFVKGGESGFFEALKPAQIKECEEKLGPGRTRRQGDIFVYTLPWSWARFFKRFFIDPIADAKLTVEKGSFHLFGTRHVLSGYCVDVPKSSALRGRPVVGSGTLEAPDHAPLILQGPHLFSQAALLFRPQSAD